MRNSPSAPPCHIWQAAAAQEGDAAVVIISPVSAAQTATANSFGALKAAQIHFAKGLAKEKAKRHVRVNTIPPDTMYFDGGVWHQLQQGMPELFKTTMARNPTGAWPRRGKLRMRPCSWPARRRLSPPASTWWSMASSPVA